MNINNNEPITIWLSPVECAAGMKPVGWELGLRVRKPRKDNWNPGLTQDLCLQGRIRIGKEERRLKQALDMVAQDKITCFQHIAADCSFRLYKARARRW